jgi:hypothetical protein
MVWLRADRTADGFAAPPSYVGRMAQEFGDPPEAAAERMRWVRQLAAGLVARLEASPGLEPSGRPRSLPARALLIQETGAEMNEVAAYSPWVLGVMS